MDYRLIFGLLGAAAFAWGAMLGLRRRKFPMGGRFGRPYVVTRSLQPIRYWSTFSFMAFLAVAFAIWALTLHAR